MNLTAEAFDFVRDLVRREAAIVLETGKEYLVESRLIPLARDAGVDNVSDYVSKLRASDRNTQLKVVDALTTNETSWFRDIHPFTALERTVIPELTMARIKEHRLRIWSAACSSGQEPYGLAMVINESLPGPNWQLEIVATDISDSMLERAKTGLYSQMEVNRGLPAPRLVRHFHRAGTNWQVNDDLRNRVRFQKMNLAVLFPPLPVFDVVFLRNVLIYFDQSTKADILQRVRRQMAPDGYLFLGAAESTLGVDESFQRVPLGSATAYRPRN